MTTAAQLFSNNIASIVLDIVLFGPNPGVASTDSHAVDLGNKRAEIKAALVSDGHNVKYGEDVIDPNLPPPANNPFLQELMLLAEYDLIISLVYSPGTISELTILMLRQDYAVKSHLFLCHDFRDGLVCRQCELLQSAYKARFTLYNYPNDVVACNLLTLARATVADAQVAKFLSP